MTEPQIACGVWQHRSGGLYQVIGVARDDRDDTTLVVYIRLYGRDGIPMCARPVDDFFALVDGKPRFTYVGLTDPRTEGA